MSRVNTLAKEPGIIPAPGEIILGQLAINAADGKVFLKRLDGQIICIGQDVDVFATKSELQAISSPLPAPPQWGWQLPTGPYTTAAFDSDRIKSKDLPFHVAAIIRLLIQLGLASTQGTTL